MFVFAPEERDVYSSAILLGFASVRSRMSVKAHGAPLERKYFGGFMAINMLLLRSKEDES